MRLTSRSLPAFGVFLAATFVAGCDSGDGYDTEQGLGYARKACAHLVLDGGSVSTSDPDEIASQVDIWQQAADNAARAARYDPMWNPLSRATDANYRAWRLVQQGASQADIYVAVADANSHPYQPECRKAIVV